MKKTKKKNIEQIKQRSKERSLKKQRNKFIIKITTFSILALSILTFLFYPTIKSLLPHTCNYQTVDIIIPIEAYDDSLNLTPQYELHFIEDSTGRDLTADFKNDNMEDFNMWLFMENIGEYHREDILIGYQSTQIQCTICDKTQ